MWERLVSKENAKTLRMGLAFVNEKTVDYFTLKTDKTDGIFHLYKKLFTLKTIFNAMSFQWAKHNLKTW